MSHKSPLNICLVGVFHVRRVHQARGVVRGSLLHLCLAHHPDGRDVADGRAPVDETSDDSKREGIAWFVSRAITAHSRIELTDGDSGEKPSTTTKASCDNQEDIWAQAYNISASERRICCENHGADRCSDTQQKTQHHCALRSLNLAARTAAAAA